jgi:hypothetical protein
MNPERVVDIWFPGTRSFGSGYLLTDKLILTAGHVAKPSARGTPCVVRRLMLDEPELKARVAWMSKEPDAGLIMLEESVEGLDSPPDFGRAAGSRSAYTYECSGIGFPRANRDRERVRIDFELRGSATLSFRSGNFQVATPDVIPISVDGWSGISGAALFSRELLFAIVGSVKNDWGGTCLEAISIEPLLAVPGFRKALKAGGMPEPPLRPMRPSRYYHRLCEQVSQYYFFVNRGDQETVFRNSLKAAPRAFYVTGWAKDRPELLMQRFGQEKSFRDIVGDLQTDRAIVELTWPPFRIGDPALEFERLREVCARALSIPPEATKSAAGFSEALSRRPPAAIWWTFKPDYMGPGHAELLDRWIDFCIEIQEWDFPFFWFACCVLDMRERPTGWQARFQKFPEPDPDVADVIDRIRDKGKLVELDPLNTISAKVDVQPWVERITAPAELDEDAREELRSRLEEKLGVEELRLADFAEKVEIILRGIDA